MGRGKEGGRRGWTQRKPRGWDKKKEKKTLEFFSFLKILIEGSGPDFGRAEGEGRRKGQGIGTGAVIMGEEENEEESECRDKGILYKRLFIRFEGKPGGKNKLE